MNALLVDNHSLYRALIIEALRIEGIQVHVAKDAEAMRGALQKTQFDLVFCDLHLDGIDTVALVASLRERFPSLRIVALSRYSTSKEVQEKVLNDTPFNLVKPFTIEALLHLVREVVGLRSVSPRDAATSAS